MPRKIKIILFSALFVFGSLALFASYVINSAEKSREELIEYGSVPNFTFTERDGSEFGLKDMKGHITIVDFIFTSCEMACPIMSARMSESYRLFEGNDLIKFVSVSVDPEVDTLEALEEYAVKYGVPNGEKRWVFLRASIPEVVKLSEKGFMLAADDLPMGHSLKFALVDTKGQIRGYYDSNSSASLNIMKDNIRTLAGIK